MSATFRPLADCARLACSLDPFVDGELDPAHAVDVEAHLLGCPSCADRVASTRTLRAGLRRACAAKAAPDALRARLVTTMIAEKCEIATASEAEGEADAMHAAADRRRSLKYGVAFAAVAAIAVGTSFGRLRPTMDDRSGAFSYASAAPVALDDMLEDLVALHAHPLPPETTNPEELPRFDPLVGVPVRRPTFQPLGASFAGARVHALRDRRAAVLQYTAQGGHRMTMYVFDPQVVPVLRATLLHPRVVREKPVYVGSLRGYSIAAAESSRRGVGYALASDLGDDDATKFVLAAVQ